MPVACFRPHSVSMCKFHEVFVDIFKEIFSEILTTRNLTKMCISTCYHPTAYKSFVACWYYAICTTFKSLFLCHSINSSLICIAARSNSPARTILSKNMIRNLCTLSSNPTNYVYTWYGMLCNLAQSYTTKITGPSLCSYLLTPKLSSDKPITAWK